MAHRRSRIRIREASMTTSARPMSLADLIRSNRHIIELRLASPADLASITGDVATVPVVKGFLRGWQIIAIRDHRENAASLHMVGSFAMRSWITSDLLRLTPDRSLVRTRNSYYGLGHRAETALSINHLRTVARALKAWGLVDRYGLEVMRDEEFAELGDDE
jgi:hypothetical protein